MNNQEERLENLTLKEVQEIIPHRHPFLLVDGVQYVVKGKAAKAFKAVSFVEPYFQGHFPNEPVMPGVLIIEALAQTGAVAILSLPEFKGKIAYFTGINYAKFRKKVLPGDLLWLEVEIVKQRGPIGIGNAVATVNDVVVAQAELSFFIGD